MLTPLIWAAVVAAVAWGAGRGQRGHVLAGITPEGLDPGPGPGRRGEVEVVTALLLAGVAAAAQTAGEAAAFGWLAVFAVPLALVDVAVFRLPDRLTVPAYLGTLGLLAVTAFAWQRHDDLLRATLAGLALSFFYLVLFVISPAGMGLGDVKLAAALGTALGWLGWADLLTGALAAHLAAAAYGLAMIGARRAGRKTEIPFGPFMLLGALGVILGEAFT